MVLFKNDLLLAWPETLVVTEEAFACGGELEEDLTEVACCVADGFPESTGRVRAGKALSDEVGQTGGSVCFAEPFPGAS
ncbi:MAG: hypothetical protein ACI8T1_004854 [Verrucomicrobiales bacterium]|jgi:hypothetical protein